MASLTCSDPAPVRLDLDPHFRPCEPVDGDELYPNGIFEFNISRLLCYLLAEGRFRADVVPLDAIPHASHSLGLK